MVTVALAAVSLAMQTAPTWSDPPQVEGLDGAEVRTVEAGQDGSVWMSVRGRGLLRIKGGETSWITAADGLASDGIADLHEDSNGDLWAAGFGGYSVFDGTGWVPHNEFGGLEPRVVFRVYEEEDSGAVWLAGVGGAGRLSSGSWSVLRPTDGLPHQVVHGVVVDRAGVAWLACRTGLARVEDGEVTVLFAGTNFRTALAGPDGRLWFGTSEGVYQWDGVSWTRYLEDETVYPVLVSREGTIWAGSESAGILRFDGESWDPIELPPRIRGAEVFDLSQAPDGSIWVATSAGPGRYFPAED